MLKRQEQEQAELKRMADSIAGGYFGLSPSTFARWADFQAAAVRPLGDVTAQILRTEAELSRQISGIGKAFEQVNLVTNALAQFNSPAEQIRRELACRREIELLTAFGRFGGI